MTTDPRVAELEAEVRALRAVLAERDTIGEGDAEGFLAALLEAVPAYIVRADPDLRLRYVNRAQRGLSRESVVGKSIWEFVDPAHLEKARQCVAKVLATGTGDSYETVGVSAAPYEVFVEPVAETDGRRGICMVAVDLTLARRRERALQESDEKLRLALAATGIALWSWSPRTGEIEWDARMREILGRDEPLDLPSYVELAVHPDDRKAVAENSSHALEPGPWEAIIHRIVRPDGTVRWVLVRGLTVAGEGGEIERLVGGTLDVSEQRRLEEQLRHSQRLDALGHLTAGVAHNFNNLLTVITSTLDLLARRAPDASLELIDEAQQAAWRAAEMVRQLMTFAGQRPRSERRGRAIGPQVERVIDICRRTFDRHVVFECTIADDLPAVLCSEGEIEQVLMNILLNARDAVLASGRPAPRIRIKVDRTPPPGQRTPVAFVRVQIADEGVGMSDDVLAHVFDPFFTTKPPGQGTGLGLATSYAIARELGGVLTCTSTLGAGSTFDLFLPPSDLWAAQAPRTVAPAATHAGRVLLVDDEAPIRRAVAAVLEDAGFEVEGAGTGEEAVARLSAGPPIDVVLLDRSMPGAPGETFLPRMRAVAPRSRIILFSGQAIEPSLAARVDGVLVKPASSNEIVSAIAALLPPHGAAP